MRYLRWTRSFIIVGVCFQTKRHKNGPKTAYIRWADVFKAGGGWVGLRGTIKNVRSPLADERADGRGPEGLTELAREKYTVRDDPRNVQGVLPVDSERTRTQYTSTTRDGKTFVLFFRNFFFFSSTFNGYGSAFSITVHGVLRDHQQTPEL